MIVKQKRNRRGCLKPIVRDKQERNRRGGMRPIMIAKQEQNLRDYMIFALRVKP